MRILTAIPWIKYYCAITFLLLGALNAYGQAPIAVTATSNSPVRACIDTLRLTATSASAVSWSWSGPNSFTSNVQNPVIPNPTIAAAGNYSVTVTDVAGNQAADTTLVIIMNPTVNPVANQILCNGTTTAPIVFSGNFPGTQFLWTNSDSTIGLPSSGTGNIAAFQALNAKIVPDTALINVVPQYTVNGITCVGTSYTVLIIVRPSPVITTDANVAICVGGSATLQVTGGNSCSWQSAPGLSNPNSCNPVVNPTQNTTYNVTVTGAGGCTNTASIAVNIHVPQPVACNNSINVSLNQNGIVAITPGMVLQSGTSDDEVFTVEITTASGQAVPNPLTCAQIGQTLTVMVTDDCTGFSCWGNLKVEDKLAPQISCSNLDLSCAITNYAPTYLAGTLGVPNTYPTVQENCVSYTLTFVDSWNDLGCSGTINGITDLSAYLLRKWTAKDMHGNMATCSQYIYFHRLSLDSLIMPEPEVTVTCVNPNINPSVTGAPYRLEYGQIFPLYPNTSFCELNAFYTDLIIQVCDGTFKIQRTWTIYNWCLANGPTNPLIYVQIIIVSDSAGPQIACPANLTVSTNPVACCATVDLPNVVLTDNCSRLHRFAAQVDVYDQYTNQLSNSYTIDGTLTNFPGNNLATPDTMGTLGLTPCLPAGRHTVTYTAEDDCGNSRSCSFRMVVSDELPPIASCQQSTTVAVGVDGTVTVDASFLDAGSYDNCGPVAFKARRMSNSSCQSSNTFHDQLKFCCSDVGNTITVVLRVYDVAVNSGDVSLTYQEEHSNSCMVQVLVQDKIKPTCIAPQDYSIQCESFDPTLGSYGTVTATDNCCLDHITRIANYNQFDTVCNRGTILRTFQAFDCAGQSNSCTQRIVVTYNQNYYLKLPDDKILYSCDGSGDYGEPTFFGEDCELLAITHSDQVFTIVPDACYKIERTWTIINWCTYNPNEPCIEIPNPEPSVMVNSPNNIRAPVISPPGTIGAWAPTIVNLTPNATAPTDFSSFWSPNANCYTYKQIIKVVDTQNPVIECPASPVAICDSTSNSPELWNDMLWYDAATGSHDLCEGPTNLSVAAFDSCSGLNVTAHYLLFLDLDNDGVMETVVNSEQPPLPGTVSFGNALTPNFQGGEVRTFDQRNILPSGKYRFAVQEETNADSTRKIFSLRFNTFNAPSNYSVPELPYGNYKIKWFVEDGCGNGVSCEYTFSVKDCKPPTVTCINGLAINIMSTQMVQIWATDFFPSTSLPYDNCTPTSLLKYSIRRVGQGTGFPLDANGQPQTNLLFTCADLGSQPVELWAMDLAGNADYCSTYLLVQDNNNNCPVGPAAVAGQLTTEMGEGLEEATITLRGTDPSANLFNHEQLSDNTGNYAFHVGIPPGSSLTVTPTKDDNPLNGVTTYDLVLISKHILGVEPIASPYSMIAADANKSGSITGFDIIELRKLILGIYQELPNNTSWRFVDKTYVFPEPTNPFQELFPEYKAVSNFQPPVDPFDFVAIKVGDVNTSSLPNGFSAGEDRSGGTLIFDVYQDSESTGKIQAGEAFTVTFRAAEVVQGYQFTLQYLGLEVLQILPVGTMRADNFAVFPSDHTFTTAWEGGGQAEFSVRFRAQQSGELQQMLRLSSRPTRAEAYAMNTNARLDIGLKFNDHSNATVAGIGFELYQNEPNPFASYTTISFHLPDVTAATLTITDLTGRTCWTQRGNFAKGYNRIVVDGAVFPASGLYYYKLETTSEIGTGKMILVK